MRRTLLALLLLAACQTQRKAPPPSVTTEPKGPSELQQIAELEDRRSFGDGKLPAWALTHNDPKVRARALLALARIQDPESIDVVLKGLTDPDSAARIEAAFAAAELGMSWQPLTEAQKSKLTEGLKSFEASEAEAPVRLALIDALARVGTSPAADRLIDRLSIPGDVQARAALGLGVEARQLAPAQLPTRAFSALAGLIRKEQPTSTRYGAAYALAASKSVLARPALLSCILDDVSEVRAACAKGLGDAGTDADALMLKRLLDDPDYRVAVEATRALAKFAAKCKSSCSSISALGDLNFRVERLVRGDTAGGGQPLLALAQQGLPAGGKSVLVALRDQLLAALRSVNDARIRKDVANIECRLAAAIDRINGELKEVLSCGGALVPEGQRLAMGLQEVGQSPAKDPVRRVEDLGSYVFHTDPRVKLAAIEALGTNKAIQAADRLRPLIGNPDLVIAAAAVSALAKLGDKSAIPAMRALAPQALQTIELAPPLAEALELLDAKEAAAELQPWLQSTHAAVRIAAAGALTKLTGQPVAAPRVERPANQVKPPNLPKDAALKIKTEKGEFEVKLYTQDAPLTSLNLYTLARKNFFKNINFHRVVPDFVAQGGDPRGDGEGGPGYTIRCEINHRPYTRGVVGMALGGKDTGGSQLFVTLAPTPHLDGKYTAFGEVVKGQEVVDALLEGDKILEVRATP
jgi:cyclophilin family peptidyl-prolyl cis-trans isomerase/HEAT repeat protein